MFPRPALRELGVDAVVESPYGIGGPEGLPPVRVGVLHDAFKTALESPEGRKILDQLNQPLNYRSSREFAQYAKDAFAQKNEFC